MHDASLVVPASQCCQSRAQWAEKRGWPRDYQTTAIQRFIFLEKTPPTSIIGLLLLHQFIIVIGLLLLHWISITAWGCQLILWPHHYSMTCQFLKKKMLLYILLLRLLSLCHCLVLCHKDCYCQTNCVILSLLYTLLLC